MKITEFNSYVDSLVFPPGLFINVCISKNGAKRDLSFLFLQKN